MSEKNERLKSEENQKTCERRGMSSTKIWSDRKRLLVYLILAFALTWGIFLPYAFSGHRWMMGEEQSGMDQFVGLGMLCPMIAMILTRWLSKEGFAMIGEGSLMLGIDLKEGKWKIYLLAILLPWVYFEVGSALTLLFAPECYAGLDPKLMELMNGKAANVILLPVVSIASAMICSFAALGEEAGWRGYMMPKMIKLWGVKKAVLIGGILWGCWHWPLTCVGHNFGIDYWGYPYTGMLMMCVMCVFMGIVLTFVTYKTGSVWPAVILHAVNNASPSILQYFMDTSRIQGWKNDSLVMFAIHLIPMMLITVIIAIYALRSGRKA